MRPRTRSADGTARPRDISPSLLLICYTSKQCQNFFINPTNLILTQINSIHVEEKEKASVECKLPLLAPSTTQEHVCIHAHTPWNDCEPAPLLHRRRSGD